jgi:hypothetical protein
MAASILARCSGVILSNLACTPAGRDGSPEVVLSSVTCQRPVLTLSGSVAAKTIETNKHATATKSTFRISVLRNDFVSTIFGRAFLLKEV